jgi:hypothetical protein
MQSVDAEVAEMQKAYLAAVEEWVAAIREEEALVSVDPGLRVHPCSSVAK